MKNFKRWLSIMLMLCIIISAMPITALAVTEVASGTCGEKLTWVLTDDGTLTISGEGEMYNYNYYSSLAPWSGGAGADYRNQITKVVINNGVTTIANSAFFECNKLTNITIPNSVTSINSYAFSYCSNLTSINIPNSVTSIGNDALSYCSSLTNVTFPNSVTSIGEGLFESCENLTKVTLSNSITSISHDVFLFCASLASVSIPKSVTTISYHAFYGCKKLTNVYYGGSKDDWSKINIRIDNERLTKATIHYNSSGPEVNGDVRYFYKWDAENHIAYFDTDPEEYPMNFGSQVTDETNTSFIANVDSLIGTYVLAETKIRDDGMLAPNTLLNIVPVQTYTGTITEMGEYTISIDGESYPAAKKLYPLFLEVGDFVMYHLYDGKIVGISETDEEIPNLPDPEYELVFTPNEESLSTKVGQTLEIKCELYRGGVPVNLWDHPQVSISHGEDIAPLTYAGFDAIQDGSYILRLKGYTSGTAFVTISDALTGTVKTIEVKVSELDENEFVKELYQADNIINDDEINFNSIIRYINEYSPSEIIFENSNFNKSFEIWDELTLFYDSLADGDAYAKHHFEQLDVCEAILINALEYATTDKSAETWGLSTVDKTVDITKSLLETMENIIKIETNKKLDRNKDILEMTDKEKADLKSAFEKSLDSSVFKSTVADIKKSADFIDEIMKIAKTAADLVEKTTAYLELWHVSDSMVKVLEAMLAKIPDTEEFKYMREATEFCIDMINQSSHEQFVEFAILRANFMTGGKYIITEGISYLWDGIKDAACAKSPILATLLIVYKGGKTLFNSIWNIDNTSEHVFKLSVSSNYTGFLESAILKLKNEYTSSRTTENANALLNAISLLNAFAINECDIACSFAKAVDNGVAEKIAGAIDRVGSDAKTVLYEYAVSTKENFIRQNVDAATHWVYHLEEDHPEHYDNYKNLISEDIYQDALVVPITTEYSIHCPVDVCVFDKSGNLVCELNYDGAYTFGDVSAIQIGDKKIVRIINSDEYTISCNGYAEGSLNVSVSEYQGTQKIRDAAFYDLEVSEDMVYNLETKTDSEDASIYTITTEDVVIHADVDTSIDKCSEHQYSAPRFEWISANTCYAKFICVNKDDIQTVECSVTSTTTPATNSENGYTIYTANVEFNGQIYTESNTVVIPALDHELYSISGVVTSALSNNENQEIIHIVLYNESSADPIKTIYLSSGESYCFSDLLEGNYTIKFVQDGCATLTYNVSLNNTENDLTFSPFLSIIGDVDGDGSVTATDALCLKKYFVNLFTEDDISILHSDMNQDGEINSKDLLLMKKELAK